MRYSPPLHSRSLSFLRSLPVALSTQQFVQVKPVGAKSLWQKKTEARERDENPLKKVPNVPKVAQLSPHPHPTPSPPCWLIIYSPAKLCVQKFYSFSPCPPPPLPPLHVGSFACCAAFAIFNSCAKLFKNVLEEFCKARTRLAPSPFAVPFGRHC